MNMPVKNGGEGITTKAEKDWLTYFNDYLLKKGVITTEEHRAMNTEIICMK